MLHLIAFKALVWKQFFVLRQSLALSLKLQYSGTIWAHCNLWLLGSSNSHALASWEAGITGVPHHAQLIFVFLVKTGFHHFGQAALKLPTSGDPPTLASQSAGFTGVSHHVWPGFLIRNVINVFQDYFPSEFMIPLHLTWIIPEFFPLSGLIIWVETWLRLRWFVVLWL